VPNSRPHGTIPAAFTKTGRDVPPSPEVMQQTLGQVIGQAVALHVAQLLGPVLQRLVDVQEQPGCTVCAVKAKRAERDWEVAAANARAAAEPEPAKPDAQVTQSFTAGSRGPVCWSCYTPELDAPYLDEDLLAAVEAQRAAGAVQPPAE
jgi:hypothetical protein